jgi:co-chaperonin GroES (HSP10)
VKFRDYAGANVKLEGQEHAIIRAYDILAKVED